LKENSFPSLLLGPWKREKKSPLNSKDKKEWIMMQKNLKKKEEEKDSNIKEEEKS